MPVPTTPVIERFWSTLLGYIREGKVIPVIGRELLIVEHEGRSAPLMSIVANLLVDELRDDDSLDERRHALPADADVSTVIGFVRDPRQRTEIVIRAQQLIEEVCATAATPAPLRQLGEIDPFKLFISTTVDGLLTRHFHNAVAGGLLPWQRLTYHAEAAMDLDQSGPWDSPVVYQLYGATSSTPGMAAVTDEDFLEFTAALHNPIKRPDKLFAELKKHHLLVLGIGFPDWLARFFLRLLKGESFSMPANQTSEFVADSEARPDTRLGFFLECYSHKTRLCPGGSAAEFVSELHRRWKAYAPSADNARPGGVFISYSRADLPVVERLAARLEKAGIACWFDKRELLPGDPFWQIIERNIAVSSIFLPVLSETTRRRTSAHIGKRCEIGFWREWLHALSCCDSGELLHAGLRRIMPVVIDPALTSHSDYVPAEFFDVHVPHCPDGNPPDDFLRAINRVLTPRAAMITA